MGHVVAHKAGHELHSRLVKQLLASPDAWVLTTPAPVPSLAAMPRAHAMSGATS